MSRFFPARRPGKAALLLRRIRPVLLGSLALAFAIRGQSLLGALSTRSRGTVDYAVAVALILAAWAGTYRDRDSLEAPPRETSAPWQAHPWRSRAGVFFAIAVNLFAVLALRRSNYDSLAAGALWLASLVLLAAAAAGPRRDRSGESEAAGRAAGRSSRRVDLLLAVLILLFGLAVRIYRLGDWTTGMHGDEGEVGLNALEILRHPEISPFRTGWFGQPNFYYWGVALGMRVFGQGLAGLRAFSVAAGALLLVPFFFLVRRLFGLRPAVAAAVLLAVSGPAVHFSRQEFSNITTPLFLVAGFLFLAKGLETRRALPFALAGYAHMACLYFYLGGRLTPLIGAAFFAYLLLVAPLARRPRARRFRDARPLLSAAVFYSVAAFCMASPWAAYYLDHRPEWDSRVRDKLIFNQPAAMAAAHRARHEPLTVSLPGSAGQRTVTLAKDGFWPRVLWGQLKATLSILTWNYDRSGVYVTNEPATTPFEAVLVVFGIAWSLLRWRDLRMAMLSIWFWLTIVVGGVLTIDAPYLARIVGILPLLAVFSGIVLDKLALEVERLWRRSTRAPGRAGDARYVATVAVFFAVAFLGERSLRDYFVRFLGRRPFPGGMSFASFVRDTDAGAAREGRPGPMYYALGVHGVYWGYSVNRFLNPGSAGTDAQNASDLLPLLDNGERDAVFLVWASNRQYLPAIRLFYPEGEEGACRYGPPGREAEMFQFYRVRREAIDARRSLVARYRSSDGREIERAENGPGGAPPPAGLRYPARAEWTGRIFAPAFGRYRFRLHSAGGASLALDGRSFLEASESLQEAAVILARGVHDLAISAPLPGPDASIALDWSAGDFGFLPVQRRFFWSGPGAAFLGEIRWAGADGAGGRDWVEYRRDAFLGFRQAQNTLGVGGPVAGIWRGTLHAAEPGRYAFETFCSDACGIAVDGESVLENRSPDLAPRPGSGHAELSAGAQSLEVSYAWSRGFGHLEVYSSPEGGTRELLGVPSVAAQGGAWRPGEVRETRPIAPELLGPR